MKVVVDTDDMGVNEKGEFLRKQVFNHKKGYGCYTTFEVNDGFEQIDPLKYPALYKPFAPSGLDIYVKVFAFESKDIVAMWWWDGDGDLLIWVKGEPYAYENDDCKKANRWCEVEVGSEES